MLPLRLSVSPGFPRQRETRPRQACSLGVRQRAIIHHDRRAFLLQLGGICPSPLMSCWACGGMLLEGQRAKMPDVQGPEQAPRCHSRGGMHVVRTCAHHICIAAKERSKCRACRAPALRKGEAVRCHTSSRRWTILIVNDTRKPCTDRRTSQDRGRACRQGVPLHCGADCPEMRGRRHARLGSRQRVRA